MKHTLMMLRVNRLIEVITPTQNSTYSYDANDNRVAKTTTAGTTTYLVVKLYAERLDKIDIVSGNYYPTMKGGLLKPCEMSDKKVIDFVLECERNI